jgi:hypothetical protein
VTFAKPSSSLACRLPSVPFLVSNAQNAGRLNTLGNTLLINDCHDRSPILAYLFLSVVLSSGSSDSISASHIGTALTFSAGSFIFVAMHAVQELASASADVDEGGHRHLSGDPPQILGRTGRVAVFLLGTILPKMLESITGHHH